MSVNHRRDRDVTRRHSGFLPGQQERRGSPACESKATSFIQTLFRKKTKQEKDRDLPSPTSSTSSFSIDSADKYEDMFTLSVSFATLAERTDEFPHQVVVVRSSEPAGETVHEVLRKSRVLNLHFVKDTSFVLMTNEEGREYRVPFNSSLRFSPLHFASEHSSTPETQIIDRAREGYRFNSVGEILASPKLPMVVVVTEKTNGCPFDAWEIVVIKKAKQRRQDRRRYLVIYSFLTGKEVCLDDGSELKCSTMPDHFQLYISQIAKHMQLPVKVIVNKDEASRAYSFLDGEIFTLLPGGSIKSVIATCTDSPYRVLEIQADANVFISLLHPNLEVADNLLKRSFEMYQDFASVSVEEYVLGEEYEEELFSEVFDPEVGIKLYEPQQLVSGHNQTEAKTQSVSEPDQMSHGTTCTSKSDDVQQPADCDGGVAYETIHVLPSLAGSERNRTMLTTMYDDIQSLRCEVQEMKTGKYQTI